MMFSVLSFSLFLFYVITFGENYYYLGGCENKNIYVVHITFLSNRFDIIQQESGNLVNLGSFYGSEFSYTPPSYFDGKITHYYANLEKIPPQIANCPDILNKTQELWEKLK